MPDPVADPPRCDVPGCGNVATYFTDGSEKDGHKRRVAHKLPDGTEIGIDEPMNRPAVPFINVDERHRNWPHSEDAQRFAATDAYKARAARAQKTQVPPPPAPKGGGAAAPSFDPLSKGGK